MLEASRRRALGALNSRYIYGRVPLLHTVLFIIEILLTMRLVTKFNSYYAGKPILTTMITNALLGGIADTVAQSLTAIQTRRRSLPSTTSDLPSQRGPIISIELTDLKEKPATLNSGGGSLIPTTRNAPPPFDFERLTRFMAYGFMMAPLQFHWFGFLSRTFPLVKGVSSTVPALQRVAMDQLIFAPIGLAAFFTFMTVAEGGGKRAVAKKFQEVFLPALRANYMVWPAVQVLNFRAIPLQFQIPFVSTIGIAWTAYLSLTNSADEE